MLISRAGTQGWPRGPYAWNLVVELQGISDRASLGVDGSSSASSLGALWRWQLEMNVKTKHKLAAAGLIGTGFYLGACGLLYFMQRKLIYMTDNQVQGELPPEFKRWEDNGEFLGYKREQGRADALIFLHGSAHNAREWCWAVQHFPGDVYVVEFPGYGEKAGTTTEFSLCEAGLRGFDSVPPHPGTTLLCGQSLGSAVAAAILATREFKVQGVVLITPFTCLEAVAKWHYPMFPVVWLLKDRLAVLPAWDVGLRVNCA